MMMASSYDYTSHESRFTAKSETAQQDTVVLDVQLIVVMGVGEPCYPPTERRLVYIGLGYQNLQLE